MATGKYMDNKLTPKQLHTLHNIYPYHYYLQLLHVYDTEKKSWYFHGYTCRFCLIVLKKHKFACSHYKRCKVLNLKKHIDKRIDD